MSKETFYNIKPIEIPKDHSGLVTGYITEQLNKRIGSYDWRGYGDRPIATDHHVQNYNARRRASSLDIQRK